MRKRTMTLTAVTGGVALTGALIAGTSFAETTEQRAAAPAGPGSATAQADRLLGGRPSVPAALVPPAGNSLSSVFKARGVQIYGCTAGAWALIEPSATLYAGLSLSPLKPATAIHFRGPSWQSDSDGTLIEGTSPVSAPSARPNSIPQLLITAKTTRGDGVFGGVTFVQRLNTSGGVAPAGACAAGDIKPIAYTADYRFFKKSA